MAVEGGRTVRQKESRISVWDRMNRAVAVMDKLPLWWIGLLLFGAVFIPLFIWGENCVFPIHDQLDETILSYILNARHWGEGVNLFPELLGGINTSGMQPSAVLFIPLYRLFSAVNAFLIQYAVVFLCGFFGMYLAMKEMTGSSILAVAMGGCFCMLPIPPVYGLSVMGVPFLQWCFLNLWNRRRIVFSFLYLLLFGLTTHLVLIGYVVLGFWLLAILWSLLKKCCNRWICLGFGWLLLLYVLVNRSLFYELIFGGGSYVSHREELVNMAMPFWEAVKGLFLNSAQHADSLHGYLILPTFAALILGVVFYRRLDQKRKKRCIAAVAGMGILVGIAVLYGICKWQPVVDFRNSCSGFLRYFQLERFYWLYPAGWYLEFGLCFSLWWGADTRQGGDRKGAGGFRGFLFSPLLQAAILLIILFPTAWQIMKLSYIWRNVNYYNNGYDITGDISWKSFYADDLMQELEDVIGRDRKEYRIAHVGMSPAPALMHGFYTVDGYSNNYPLEYKHEFRRVIAKELEQVPETAVYFDGWGSRCYLFNAESGYAYMLGKRDRILYHDLEYDMTALKELGCEYIFSCGEILNAQELGLELLGYFETEDSFWGVWLYDLSL